MSSDSSRRLGRRILVVSTNTSESALLEDDYTFYLITSAQKLRNRVTKLVELGRRHDARVYYYDPYRLSSTSQVNGEDFIAAREWKIHLSGEVERKGKERGGMVESTRSGAQYTQGKAGTCSQALNADRCQCSKMKDSTVVKCPVRSMMTSSGAVLLIGLLLVQQAVQATAMTLQHVPGSGGRNAGDPAPGRSPGPPLMLDPPMSYQRLSSQPVSTRPIVRHRPEINIDNQHTLPDSNPDEDISRSFGRNQDSTMVVSSSTNYRDDVTQENTKPTLDEDEYALERYSSGARIPDPLDVLEDEIGTTGNGFTLPINRQNNNEAFELSENDEYMRGWRQGGLLDDLDEDQDHNISEDNPTIILTSDSDQSISLPSAIDFASYEDENNATFSLCDQGQVVTEAATGLWSDVLNTSISANL
ncbi:hypothetical protein C0J52_23231 [Blattella germanica]|nr:hypothetical protein C0J52_23231 [Blattella germanica]